MNRTLVHEIPLERLEPTLPAKWRGETNCVIGPFESRPLAQRFASIHFDFGDKPTLERIFVRANAWYVELKAFELESDPSA